MALYPFEISFQLQIKHLPKGSSINLWLAFNVSNFVSVVLFCTLAYLMFPPMCSHTHVPLFDTHPLPAGWMLCNHSSVRSLWGMTVAFLYYTFFIFSFSSAFFREIKASLNLINNCASHLLCACDVMCSIIVFFHLHFLHSFCKCKHCLPLLLYKDPHECCHPSLSYISAGCVAVVQRSRFIPSLVALK